MTTARTTSDAQRQSLLAGARRGPPRARTASAILRAVVQHGPLPRVRVAEHTGLSTPSVTRITAELIDRGVLRELTGSSGGRQGAPRIPIEVAAEHFVALGVHLGQRRANVGVVDLCGRVFAQAEVRYHTTRPTAVLTTATSRANQLLSELPNTVKVIGTGLSVGGWVDSADGMVIDNPGLAWTKLPLRELAAARLPGPVFVDSTYRGLARAELCFRPDRGMQGFVLLFIGNLIGAAVAADGHIQEGARSAAGNIAHLPVAPRGAQCAECGRHNCFLTVASDHAVTVRAASRGLLRADASDTELTEFIQTSPAPVLRTLLRPRARAIGEVVANLVDILDPEHVMLADAMLSTPGYRQTILTQATRGRQSPLPSEHLVQTAPDSVLSAAMSALDDFYTNPYRLRTEPTR